MNTIKTTVIAFTVSILLLTASVNTKAQSVTIVKTAPRGSVMYDHAGISYRYYDGLYYKPYQEGYMIVSPPLGIRVTVLPRDFTVVRFGDISYFYTGGIYYHEYAPHLYQVVAPSFTADDITLADRLDKLPETTELVQISGKEYYKVNASYYEKTYSENGTGSYILVGTTKP
jgi:hypothetical protein